MKPAFIRIADCFGPLIPNPSPPEYRREKGARSIKAVLGNSTRLTIFLTLNTVSAGHHRLANPLRV